MSEPDSASSTPEPAEGIIAPYPLNPAPSASPEAVAGWLHRVTKGVLLCAIGFILYQALPLSRSFWPSGSALPIAETPWALALLVGVWFLTVSEPGREGEHQKVRWLARIGLLAWAVRIPAGVSLACERNGSEEGAPWLLAVYLAASVVAYSGTAALLFCHGILATRLGRRILRFLFRILSLFAVFGVAMQVVFLASMCVSIPLTRDLALGPLYVRPSLPEPIWPSVASALIVALLTSLPFWLLWGLLRRATRAVRAKQDPQFGAPAASGDD